MLSSQKESQESGDNSIYIVIINSYHLFYRAKQCCLHCINPDPNVSLSTRPD